MLDFGLAKAHRSHGAHASSVARVPDDHLARDDDRRRRAAGHGSVYVAGAGEGPRRPIKRSDIWAFGCVLYEMLSGQRAFKGDDIADTLAAVLRQDIDWTALPASTPAPVRRLIARCLDRDVRRRLRDIGEARARAGRSRGLRRRRRGGVPAPRTAAAPVAPRDSRRALGNRGRCARERGNRVPQTLAGAPRRHSVPVHARRGPGVHTATGPIWSPSLRTARRWPTRNGRLYLRSMSELEARPIAGADTAGIFIESVFSPDSRSMAFWSGADQTLKKVAVAEGQPSDLFGGPTVWHELGRGRDRIRSGNKGIMRVSANGGTPEVLVTGQRRRTDVWPSDPARWRDRAVHPRHRHGRRAVGQGADCDAVTRSGERKILIDGGSDARYVPTGHLVYAIGGIVFGGPDGPSPPGSDRWTRCDRRRRQASGLECHGRDSVRFLQHRVADLRARTGFAGRPVGSGDHRPEG